MKKELELAVFEIEIFLSMYAPLHKNDRRSYHYHRIRTLKKIVKAIKYGDLEVAGIYFLIADALDDERFN